MRDGRWPFLLPLREKVSPQATDEGCSSAALRPSPLIRLDAARRSTFSHKGRRKERTFGHLLPINGEKEGMQ
ncbi:hypothetical protein ASC75_03465 [Aminobacter sp. DSM 101952]|nr:hypothetical protein ASC75_03465 [Aminobacter sp. DSM 101952]